VSLVQRPAPCYSAAMAASSSVIAQASQAASTDKADDQEVKAEVKADEDQDEKEVKAEGDLDTAAFFAQCGQKRKLEETKEAEQDQEEVKIVRRARMVIPIRRSVAEGDEGDDRAAGGHLDNALEALEIAEDQPPPPSLLRASNWRF
jgi:hypothetical protein